MKKKTILAASLAAVLILSCFTGCSKNKAAAENDSGAGTAPEQAEVLQPETELTLKDTEVLAEVTAVEGQNVTFRIFGGRRSELPMGNGQQFPGMPGGENGQQPPEMPDGENGQQPPEMPGSDNGQQPPEMPGSENGQQPPEMPDGENGQQPPEMPGGENGQQPPELTEGQADPTAAGTNMGGRDGRKGNRQESTVTLTLDADQASGLAVGDLVRLSFDTEGKLTQVEAVDPSQMGGFHGGNGGFPGGNGGFPGGNGGFPGGQGGSANSGTAAAAATEDLTGEALSSTAADENALRVDGSTVTLTDLTLTKTGDSSNTETSDFYGMNAGLLATNGASVTVEGGSFTTDGAGANALFCYGSGTTLTVKNARIHTNARNSGGIQTAGGGTTIAENLTVETEGASAAAIRSDRGGGTVTVTGGSYVTHGTGSPAIYSTAEIAVTGAALTATGSEAVVVEGKNSVELTDCTVSGSMAGTYGEGSGENLHGVMIYQSMSGDAGVGKGSFSMTGGSLTTTVGDLFYVTNTKAEINLTGVELQAANGILLRVAGNDGSRGWGSAGSNGGSVTLTASNQVLTGDFVADEISSLKLKLSDGSVWTGTVNSEGEAGQVQLTLESGCAWSLTGDAWLTAFSGDVSSIQANGYHVYVNGEPIL